ncbi:hypothetical protein Q5752_003401 [Cryptotrichosporon argae]
MVAKGAFGVSPQPQPGIRRVFWRVNLWLDATFAFAMLEPWELVIVWSIIALVTLLFWVSVFTYLPAQTSYMARRFAYYVYGDEGADPLAGVKGAVGAVVGRGIGAVRGRSEL